MLIEKLWKLLMTYKEEKKQQAFLREIQLIGSICLDRINSAIQEDKLIKISEERKKEIIQECQHLKEAFLQLPLSENERRKAEENELANLQDCQRMALLYKEYGCKREKFWIAPLAPLTFNINLIEFLTVGTACFLVAVFFIRG
ncbi:hypothetical protein SAMN02746089_02569 [Caldanaerobius fijiensis DSM 17918]|uniref:Uncharacterized protein n=1 Tax=Caldanaerobius fijiensis DSM 17918 TaxID=1121256 RepID=A0A1M5EKR9_9THEO|nr:hypothetical protein [Caldanaerobius fijiensis]SHF79868.1 hypothetical protein SAMN02746089_02569 [Caldanaerobius fijiensis DSM 17918]